MKNYNNLIGNTYQIQIKHASKNIDITYYNMLMLCNNYLVNNHKFQILESVYFKVKLKTK